MVGIRLSENKVRPLVREVPTKAALSIITFHIYDRTSEKHKEQSTNNTTKTLGNPESKFVLLVTKIAIFCQNFGKDVTWQQKIHNLLKFPAALDSISKQFSKS